ncbi:MAG: DNA cytosine methyltransferase [Rhodocyclaceae bacterium]
MLVASLSPFKPIEHHILKVKKQPGVLSRFIGDLSNEEDHSVEIFRTPSKMSQANSERVNILFSKNIYDLPNQFRPACHRDKSHSYVSVYGRLRWDQPAQTITSGFGSMGQGRYIHPERKRTITPHEAARIQGFPDFFDFSEIKHRTSLQEIIANAVPPPIIAEILSHLLGDHDCDD